MAICKHCKGEMLTVAGCTYDAAVINGKPHQRLKESRCGEDEYGNPCHDCGRRPGHVHHYGCDNETCPVCGGQLASCDCELTALLNGG